MPALRWPRAARPLNPAVMDEKDPVQRAIAALTDAALAATDNGGRERPDFGEIVCRVITHVAANWEAWTRSLRDDPDPGKPTSSDRSWNPPPPNRSC